jgi:hypothetical protein
MKKVIIVFSFLAMLYCRTLFCQIDTTLKKYFPMEIGNVWEYTDLDRIVERVTVIGDTLMPNNKVYRIFDEEYNYASVYHNIVYYRIDDSMRVWAYFNDYSLPCDREVIMYYLSLKDSSCWKECKYPLSNLDTKWNYPSLARTENIYYYGLDVLKTTKIFCGTVIDSLTKDTSICGSFYYSLMYLAKDVGVTFIGPNSGVFLYLYGAIVNGKQYGTITSINGKNNETLTEFNLEQNYPNPFNSETTIKYIVIKNGYITITINDILGRDIIPPMKEYKQKGEYNLKLSNNIFKNLTSGVYFYSIYMDDIKNKITKKMTLLK